ncbi:MAG: hypothetical protein MIO92_08410 [Methanosarcinaceae archaeon]|nr:hypothetical protein [Methanosarcinaceae archaeon]
MKNNRNSIREQAAEYAKEIYESKKEFHREMAKLPIEEKIRILIELQKLSLAINHQKSCDELPRVWEI